MVRSFHLLIVGMDVIGLFKPDVSKLRNVLVLLSDRQTSAERKDMLKSRETTQACRDLKDRIGHQR